MEVVLNDHMDMAGRVVRAGAGKGKMTYRTTPQHRVLM